MVCPATPPGSTQRGFLSGVKGALIYRHANTVNITVIVWKILGRRTGLRAGDIATIGVSVSELATGRISKSVFKPSCHIQPWRRPGKCGPTRGLCDAEQTKAWRVIMTMSVGLGMARHFRVGLLLARAVIGAWSS
jgi:hypothetical protein